MTDHAIERAAERHGIEIGTADITRILNALHDGRGILMARLKNGTSRYAVKYKEKAMKVIVTDNFSHLVTILPNTIKREDRKRTKRRNGVQHIRGRSR